MTPPCSPRSATWNTCGYVVPVARPTLHSHTRPHREVYGSVFDGRHHLLITGSARPAKDSYLQKLIAKRWNAQSNSASTSSSNHSHHLTQWLKDLSPLTRTKYGSSQAHHRAWESVSSCLHSSVATSSSAARAPPSRPPTSSSPRVLFTGSSMWTLALKRSLREWRSASMCGGGSTCW